MDSYTNYHTIAIIHAQKRKLDRLTNERVLDELARSEYPIAKPLLTEGSTWRIPCTRVVFGLRHYNDDRGDINRHIWNEMQVSVYTLAHRLLTARLRSGG